MSPARDPEHISVELSLWKPRKYQIWDRLEFPKCLAAVILQHELIRGTAQMPRSRDPKSPQPNGLMYLTLQERPNTTQKQTVKNMTAPKRPNGAEVDHITLPICVLPSKVVRRLSYLRGAKVTLTILASCAQKLTGKPAVKAHGAVT